MMFTWIGILEKRSFQASNLEKKSISDSFLSLGSYFEDGSQNVIKEDILAAVVACRKSHTSEQYYGNRASLMRMTKDLIVKPGRTKNAVTFPQYYLANWDPIVPMWVYAHRRTLRLQVIYKLLNITCNSEMFTGMWVYSRM